MTSVEEDKMPATSDNQADEVVEEEVDEFGQEDDNSNSSNNDGGGGGSDPHTRRVHDTSLFGDNWKLVDPSEFPQKVLEVQENVHKTLVRQWRAAITGDPDKRIRDSLDESKVRTRVKQVDALSFTIGVAFSYVVQFIALKRPDLFPHLYLISMAILLPHRYFTYRSTNDQYFMLDFCYWVNGALILQELICDCSQPDGFCSAWFKVSYVIVAGPISSAVVIWANSLVFHSIDKVTSFAIHIIPAILVFLKRWDPLFVSPDSTEVCYPDQELNLYTGLLLPCLCWVTWEAIYVYIQFTYLNHHPELTTSQRYLQTLSPNAKPSNLQSIGWKIGTALGLYGQDESMDSLDVDGVASTTVFVLCSATILFPTVLLGILTFHSLSLNFMFILLMVWSGIWRGGTYYIHIFSSRYNKKFPQRRASILPGFNKDK